MLCELAKSSGGIHPRWRDNFTEHMEKEEEKAAQCQPCEGEIEIPQPHCFCEKVVKQLQRCLRGLNNQQGLDPDYAMSGELPKLFKMINVNKFAKGNNYTFTAKGKTTIKMSFAANDAANQSCIENFKLFDFALPNFKQFYEDQTLRKIEEDSAKVSYFVAFS